MDRLLDIQRNIEARIDAARDASMIERLSVTTAHGRKYVRFYGDPYSESFAALLDALADPGVAETMASLELCGPDEGANGTKNWNLSRLADSPAAFPNLRHMSIKLTKPTDHNKSIVAAIYEEAGVLAAILAKAPRLESLVAPSAPNAEFFCGDARPIRFLSIDAGYDHQGFIANLAHSTRFPHLSVFEFGEYCETYMDDFRARVTPFAHYRELFASPTFEPVKVFLWRNPLCTASELTELKALLQKRQVSILRWTYESL